MVVPKVALLVTTESAPTPEPPACAGIASTVGEIAPAYLVAVVPPRLLLITPDTSQSPAVNESEHTSTGVFVVSETTLPTATVVILNSPISPVMASSFVTDPVFASGSNGAADKATVPAVQITSKRSTSAYGPKVKLAQIG